MKLLKYSGNFNLSGQPFDLSNDVKCEIHRACIVVYATLNNLCDIPNIRPALLLHCQLDGRVRNFEHTFYLRAKHAAAVILCELMCVV